MFLLFEIIVYNGALIINGIVSEDKQFLSYQTFQNKLIISTQFQEIYAIVGAVPKGWKILFQSKGECMILKITLLTD